MPSVIYHISVTIDVILNYNEIFTENKIKPLEPTYFMHLHKLHITSHKCDLFACCCVSVIRRENQEAKLLFFNRDCLPLTDIFMRNIQQRKEDFLYTQARTFPSLKHVIGWVSFKLQAVMHFFKHCRGWAVSPVHSGILNAWGLAYVVRESVSWCILRKGISVYNEMFFFSYSCLKDWEL